ncbi:hypothetical protein PFISCL1PPCAC_26437, partial [Pristionchus fissidentatus]
SNMQCLPPEVSVMVIKHLGLNDKLNLRKACRHLNKVTLPQVPELARPQECVIESVSLHELSNSIHLTVIIDKIQTAQWFVDLGSRADHCWKRKL